MSVYFTTAARVKRRLGQSDLGSDFDLLVADLIEEVSGEFEVALARHAESTSRTVVMDVDRGQREFRLRGVPVTSITSVKYATDRDFASATALDSTLYHARTGTESSLLHIEGGVGVGRGVLQVVYTGGLAATTAALMTAYPDLAGAATNEVVNRFTRQAHMSVSAVNTNGQVTHYRGFAFLPHTVSVLKSRGLRTL